MSTIGIYPSVLFSSNVLFDTAAFQANFNFLELSMNRYLWFVVTVALPVAKEVLDRKVVKVLLGKYTWKEFHFLKHEGLKIGELVTE